MYYKDLFINLKNITNLNLVDSGDYTMNGGIVYTQNINIISKIILTLNISNTDFTILKEKRSIPYNIRFLAPKPKNNVLFWISQNRISNTIRNNKNTDILSLNSFKNTIIIKEKNNFNNLKNDYLYDLYTGDYNINFYYFGDRYNISLNIKLK